MADAHAGENKPAHCRIRIGQSKRRRQTSLRRMLPVLHLGAKRRWRGGRPGGQPRKFVLALFWLPQHHAERRPAMPFLGVRSVMTSVERIKNQRNNQIDFGGGANIWGREGEGVIDAGEGHHQINATNKNSSGAAQISRDVGGRTAMARRGA